MRNESLRKQSKLVEYISSLAEAFEFCWSSFEDEHNTLLKSTRRNVKFNKCACGTPDIYYQIYYVNIDLRHQYGISVAES